MTAPELLDALRRHWKIPLLALLVGLVGIVAVVATHAPPRRTYVASSTLQLTTEDIGLPLELRGRLAEQVDAATRLDVVTEALRRASAPPSTPVEVSTSAEELDPEHPTNQVVISVETPSRTLAVPLARELAGAFLDMRKAAQLPELQARAESTLRQIDAVTTRLDALPPGPDPLPVRRGGEDLPPAAPTDLVSSQRLALQQTLDGLRASYGKFVAMQAVADGGGTVIGLEGPGERTQRSSLSGPMALLVALTLLVGVGGAVLAHQLDDSLRGGDAARLLRAPMLGRVPGRRRFGRHAQPEVFHSGPGGAAFKALAGTLKASGGARQRLLVTSPNESTDLASMGANLAAGLAQLGLGVALVGTDPRHLGTFRALGLNGQEGFSDLVYDAAAGALNGRLRRSLHQIGDMPNLWALGPGEERGTTPLLAVTGLLSALEAEGLGIDVTIVVGRPFLADVDAAILASEVGAVLWTLDPQSTTREDAEEAARRLELTRASAVGVVLADSQPSRS